MQRPLLVLVLLHVAGILCANSVPLPLGPLLAGTFLLAFATLTAPHTRRWLMPPLLILTGAASFAVHVSPPGPGDLRTLFPSPFQWVTVRGTLAMTPEERVVGDDGAVYSGVEMEVSMANGDAGIWQAATGRILASTPGTLPWHAGQEVEVSGVLSPPDPAAAPGLFDARAHLARKGIHLLLRTESATHWAPAPGSPLQAEPWGARFRNWARATLGTGFPPDDPQVQLLWAMTLGWRTGLTGEVSEPFMRSGTLHVFAISGLHISLIAGILLSLLRVLGLPRPHCGLILIPALWFYAAATGWQPSAVRSTTMASVIIIGWSLRRPADLLNSLSAAALFLLLLDPQQLFLPGFQLSFSVVACIALFVPFLDQQRQRLLQPDPFLLRTRPNWWKRLRDRVVHGVTATAVTSFAAFLGSLPMTACYFNLLTPVALPANLIIVPLSSLALMSSLGSILTEPWFHHGSTLFNHSAWFWMKAMIWLSETAAGLPGAWRHVASPSPHFFVLYYGALLTFTLGWHRTRHRNWLAAGFAVTFLAWAHGMIRESQTTRLVVLPLAGGEALFLDAPGRANDCLVDCGDATAARRVTLPFLRSAGINTLPRLILTHGDIRNVGGTAEFEGSIRFRQFTFSPVPFRSPAYRRLRTEQESKLSFEEVQRGTLLGPWRILHPAAEDRFPLADDGAMVLEGDFGSTRVLFLSDLGRRGQSTLLNRSPDLRADILICGLPRESAPLSPALLDVLKPRLIIVTDSNHPANERAGREMEAALSLLPCQTFYTRNSGGISIRFERTGWSLETARGETARSGE